MGYALSKNGINWKRKDNLIGIFKSKKGWDSEMITYPNVIYHDNKYFMFYNIELNILRVLPYYFF